MSGTFPAAIAPRQVTIDTDAPSLVSYARSGRRHTRELPGHRFRLRATFGTLTNEEGRILMAFAALQRGQYDSFQFVSPTHADPRGVATGTPQVNGGSQAGRSIATKGWTTGITGIMKAGDLVKFAGHSKVYMLTADANSNGSGNATLAIEPALIVVPANNEALTVIDVPFTVAFVRDREPFEVRPPIQYEWSTEMVEVY